MATSLTCDRCGDVIPNGTKPGKLQIVLTTNNPAIPDLAIGKAGSPEECPDLCAKCVPHVFNYIVERVQVGAKDVKPTEIGKRARKAKE